MPKLKKKAKGKKKTTAAKKSAKRKVVKKKTGKKKKATARKKKKILAIPKGYNNVTPYLIVNDGARAIDFYKMVFGAKEKMKMMHSGGKVGHAELQIGDTKIMLADECQEMNSRSPHSLGGTPVTIHLYAKDVDNVVQRAVNAGARLERPVENMFYGDRCGAVEDPFGHRWYVATHVEDVPPREMAKRAEKIFNNNNS